MKERLQYAGPDPAAMDSSTRETAGWLASALGVPITLLTRPVPGRKHSNHHSHPTSARPAAPDDPPARKLHEPATAQEF